MFICISSTRLAIKIITVIISHDRIGFNEVPLLQLTLRLASSLQRSKLTTQLEFTYLGAQCWRMWLHACCFAVA
jgi:hypothetical protein